MIKFVLALALVGAGIVAGKVAFTHDHDQQIADTKEFSEKQYDNFQKLSAEAKTKYCNSK